MSKRVEINSKIEAAFKKSMGDENAKISNFAIFEASAINTKNLRRSYGLYNNAVVTRSVLDEMAAALNKDGGARHLQVMHNNDLLPVGRIFAGEVIQSDTGGDYELRVLFGIPLDKTELLSDVENGVIDEVSIGILSKHAYCSECNFDYFGEEASFENRFELVCSNGHQIGVDGTHVRLVGLRDFSEVSLVNRGAAQNAKILSKAKQIFSKDTMSKLAASGHTADIVKAMTLVLNGSLGKGEFNNPTSKGDDMVDKATLELIQEKADEVANLKADISAKGKELEAANAEISSLKATVESKDKEITELNQKINSDVTDITEKFNQSEAKLKESFEKIFPHAKAALIASGVAEGDLPNDVTGLLATIEKAGLKLHQVFGAGSFSKEDKAGLGKTSDAAQFGAFKLTK